MGTACLFTVGPLGWLPLAVAVAALTTPSAGTRLHPVFAPHLPPRFAQTIVIRKR